eukprot:5395955-Amphidinium_carterae.1
MYPSTPKFGVAEMYGTFALKVAHESDMLIKFMTLHLLSKMTRSMAQAAKMGVHHSSLREE